jgi:plastocyanin
MKPRRAFIAFIAILPGLVAAGCGSSSSPSTPSATGPTAGAMTINIIGEDGGMSFSPSSATVKAGQPIVWHNTDVIVHDPTQNSANGAGGGSSGYGGGASNSSGFSTGDVSGGATSAAITIANPGTYAYHCAIHPSMVGTITVQ